MVATAWLLVLTALLPGSIALLYMGIQSQAGSLKRNMFIGIRTVAVMRDDETWEVGHKACAPTIIGLGVLGLLFSAATLWSAYRMPEYMTYFTGAYVVTLLVGVFYAAHQAHNAVKEMDTRP